jgi:hypothetical protein
MDLYDKLKALMQEMLAQEPTGCADDCCHPSHRHGHDLLATTPYYAEVDFSCGGVEVDTLTPEACEWGAAEIRRRFVEPAANRLLWHNPNAVWGTREDTTPDLMSAVRDIARGS